MRLGYRVHKGKPETVSRRVGALHEALESPAANVGRESRTIVFDHQFRRPLKRMQSNRHSASLGQMCQLVFKKIAYHSIEQRQVSVYDHMIFDVSRHLVVTLSHGGVVDVDELSYDIGKVDGVMSHVKRARFGFGKIQRGVQ